MVLLTRLIVSLPSRETRLRFISAVLYRLTLLLFPPRINFPLYMRMVRRNVIGSQPDAMNVTEVIILLTFVISSDGMYGQIILRTVICLITFMADITAEANLKQFNC